MPWDIDVLMDHNQDQPWSEQDTHQIIGRCQRKGQTKPVFVINFIAELTPDVILLRGASSKGNQLQEFLKHPANQGEYYLS